MKVGTAEIAIVRCECFFVLERTAKHSKPRFCSRRGRILEGRDRGWNENHFRETQLFKGFPCENEMRVMNRIERSAVNADFARVRAHRGGGSRSFRFSHSTTASKFEAMK